ncbi:MAG: phosphoenolpyruvate--protein phosphotransferase [Alphaproteobacteria bacterium]|nr:phosphoenolpyruvate--protein phosphotransferase [Alphaproteobacteria bacterium]
MPHRQPTPLHGVACAPGRAAGRLFRFVPVGVARPPGPGEVEALERAVAEVRTALAPAGEARGSADEDLTALADVQRGLLADPLLIGRAREAIQGGASPVDAVEEAVVAAEAMLRGIGDPVMAARADDVRSLGDRLHAALLGQLHPPLPPWPVILCARTIPADVLLELAVPRGAGPRPVRALLLERGGPLTHTAILARQRGLPVIGGLEGLLDRVRDGDAVLVDGDRGEAVLHPDREAIRRFHERGPLRTDRPASALQQWANIDLPEDAAVARRRGAAGIALFRTDGLLDRRGAAPPVAAQADAYARALQAWPHGTVVIRLFDDPGTGPLGPRGIRALDHAPARLGDQVEALGRAAARAPDTHLVLLAPMVTSPVELDRLAAVVAARWPADSPPPIAGVMVETPAAALDLDPLLDRVAHVAVGTNDLLQLTVGADREDPAVAALLDAEHPALWTLLERIGQRCAERGIPAIVCGALAAEPRHRARLASLGFTGVGVGLADLPGSASPQG